MNMDLFIDTTIRHRICLKLINDGIEIAVKNVEQHSQAEEILPTIETLLNEQHIPLRDIVSVHVHTGPGSFTGIRVGVAVASALSALLTIPINNSMTNFPHPVYEVSKFDY